MGKFWINIRGRTGVGHVVERAYCAGILFWQAGYPQWAFLVLFAVLWLFAGVCLANDRFNEESGLILARVLDENMDQVQERIHRLQEQLAAINASREFAEPSARQAGAAA
jgi:hypothetical protein